MPGRRLSLAAARRIALAAQGFGRPRPASVGMRQVQRVIDEVAQFQLDSINVVVRAQYMPLFARLGPYDPALVDRASGRSPRRLFEYWGHAACLIDVHLQPALRFRMRSWEQRGETVARILDTKPDLLDRVLADLAAGGPLTARDIENVEERRRDHWGWNWSEAKYVLEYLLDCGRVSVSARNSQFERRYDLTERVLPAAVVAADDLTPHESHQILVRRAARALGVADLTALASYFYLKRAPVRDAVSALEASGELERVEVAGLDRPHWLWHAAARPRAVRTQALLAPFDTLVHERGRVLDLFGVHYRIEVYTPAAQRRYGYYVYLFLCDEAIAARVDLKADRGAGALLVRSAWLEEGSRGDEVAPRLADELRAMASWLGLGGVRVEGPGTLSGRLAREF